MGNSTKKNDHYNFSRTWICHFGSNSNIPAKCVANEENWGQTEGTWHCVPRNVFRQTSSLQLLPTSSPKYLGIYSFLFGLSHPLFAAGAGAVYLASRIVYSLGYYTGNPKS